MTRWHVLAVGCASFMAILPRTALSGEPEGQAGEPQAAAPAASGTTLTLDEVTRSILAHHPLLFAAEQEKAIANADVLSAEGGFDPSLKARVMTFPLGPYVSDRLDTTAELPTSLWGTRLFGGYRVSRGSFADYDGKMVTGDYGEARVGMQVPLWRDRPIDRRRAALQRAELGTNVARYNVEQQRLEVVRAGSHRYWDWVAAGERLQVARDILAIATARDAGLKVRVDRGDIPAFERTENERVIHQRTAQVASTERALQNASIELSLFLRNPDGSPRRPDPSRLPSAFPNLQKDHPADTSSAERKAAARRPELRRFELLLEQTRIDRDLANNQRKLGLNLSVVGSKDFGPGPDPKLLKPELEVSLMLDVPLFTRVQDGRFKAAQAGLARLDFQARFARERVTADVRDASSAITMAEKRISAVRREVMSSRQLVEMERQRFELGEGTLLLVNIRERDYAEAEQREIDALSEYFKAVASERAAVAEMPK